MDVRKRSSHVDRADVFVCRKSGMMPVPVSHRLIREALAQAALDPAVRTIEYLQTVLIGSKTIQVDAIVIVRDDGPHYLDVIEARPPRSSEEALLAAGALSASAIRPLILTKTDISSEPRFTNVRTVWAHADCSVPLGVRLQVLGTLSGEGITSLADLLGRLRADRDPAPVVMAMACLDLLELDLVSAPIGPSTLVRMRG